MPNRDEHILQPVSCALVIMHVARGDIPNTNLFRQTHQTMRPDVIAGQIVVLEFDEHVCFAEPLHVLMKLLLRFRETVS